MTDYPFRHSFRSVRPASAPPSAIRREVRLGVTVPELSPEPLGEIIPVDPVVAPYCRSNSVRAYLAWLMGTRLAELRRARPQVVHLPDAGTARHICLVGATGGGKSLASVEIATALVQAGCSALVLSPKGQDIDRMLTWAVSSGFPPERLILLDPRRPAGAPGWNPLRTGVPVTQAVADFVDVLEKAYAAAWGQRLRSLLENGASVVASLPELGLYELARMLGSDDYRKGLLQATLRQFQPLPAYLEEAVWFLGDEFGRWPPSVRLEAASAVLNKLRPLLRSDYLAAVLGCRRQTLDLASLWQQSFLVLVHLDRPTLGEEGVRVMAGLLLHSLYRTSLRTPGPVPVVCLVDELPIVEGMVGDVLTEILAVARSQNLRLLLACQHFEQLSNGLRVAMLANAAVQVFFRVGHADARLIASSLAVGSEARVRRAVVRADQIDRQTGQPVLAEWGLALLSAEGGALRLSGPAWDEVSLCRLEGMEALQTLQDMAAASHIPRLYVQPPGGEPVALHHYVADLPSAGYGFTGPAPVELVVRFPRPHISQVERWTESDRTAAWTRTLQSLPVQHAAVRVLGGDPVVARVDDFVLPAVEAQRLAEYLEAVEAAHGQSAAEVAAVRRWRRAQVERVIRDGGPPEAENDDDSIF